MGDYQYFNPLISAVVILVAAFNLMGDALRDVLDPKEVQK